jgi:DNA-binding transcriptional LysR family regulator
VFAPLYIVPTLPAFLKDHPKVEVELDLSDRYVDLVGGPADGRGDPCRCKRPAS